MSFEVANSFRKDNLDFYLKELAKEYRKLGGKAMPAEIILIGGAAVIANYGFRNMTTDVDAVIHAASVMKDAINNVGDRLNLPKGWLNADFMHTLSYFPKMDQYSVYYKSFYGVLNVRTVSAEYLLAMKLCSGRKYKNDLSDIIGILYEHEKRNMPITMSKIDKAVISLYGGWENISADSKKFIEDVMLLDNLEQVYNYIKAEEKYSKEILKGFEQGYPGVMNADNVNSIFYNLKKKEKSKAEILQKLKAVGYRKNE